MDIGEVATKVFPLTILVMLFSIGLRTHPQDALYLLRQWDKGLRALTAMFVVFPAVIILMCLALDMARPVNAVFIALAVAPMLPALPNTLAKLGTEHEYAISLSVLGALASLVAAPAVFWVVEQIVGTVIDIDTRTLLQSLAKGLFLPLAVGAAVHVVAPGMAMRAADLIVRVATPVLLVCVLLIIWKHREIVMAQLDAQVLLAIVVFVIAGLAVGHLLGGPERSERAALAMTTASRNFGFAMAIIKAIIPEGVAAAGGVILLYFLGRAILTRPYARWMGQ